MYEACSNCKPCILLRLVVNQVLYYTATPFKAILQEYTAIRIALYVFNSQ